MSRLFTGFCFLSLLGLLGLQSAQAGVIVGGTRIIYDASKKEASIAVKNPEKTAPYLIQSWIENYPQPTADKAPFIMTPPLFRLDAGKENIVRIIRTGGNLPEDRESVFWANIKSISACLQRYHAEQMSLLYYFSYFIFPLNSINRRRENARPIYPGGGQCR